MLATVFVLALIAGGIGWLTRQRTPQPGAQGHATSHGPSHGTSYGPSHGTPDRDRDGYATAVRSRELADGEAETSYWVDRLGAGITALDGHGHRDGEAARQALSDAADRHTSARRQLREAVTLKQFELATRAAVEGLYYVRAARTALDLDPGPEIGPEQVPQLSSTRRVTIDDQEYVASPQPGDATPYYYPGGRVGGRTVPGGWYSTPWWKTALVVGGAGLGSMVLLDALFDHGPGDGGLFGIGHHGSGGGFGSGFGGGLDGPGGMLGGGLFGGDMDGFGF